MISLTATRVVTKLRQDPYTETAHTACYGLVYRLAVEIDEAGGQYARRLHRVRGHVYSTSEDIGERLMTIDDPVDLIVYYESPAGQPRKRSFLDVVFTGKISTEEPLQEGSQLPSFIRVPFVVQVMAGETIDDHVVDEPAPAR